MHLTMSAETDDALLTALQAILKPTTSRKKRGRYTKILHESIECDPYILDALLGYALENRCIEPSEFLPTLTKVQMHIDTHINNFLAAKAKEAMPKINREIIEFYEKNAELGDKKFAECLKEISDSGLSFFEFPLHDSYTDYKECKYFHIRNGWTFNNDRGFDAFVDDVDFVILYHATSTVFEDKITEDGLLPPEATGNNRPDLDEFKEYLGDRGEAFFKEFKKQYNETRKKSVYFSTARLASVLSEMRSKTVFELENTFTSNYKRLEAYLAENLLANIINAY